MGLINICNQREGSVLLFKDCCSCSSLRTFLCCRAAQRYGFLGNVRRSSTGRDKLTPTRRMSTGKPYLKDYTCPFDRELSSSAVLQSIPSIFVWLSNFLANHNVGSWKIASCLLGCAENCTSLPACHLPGRLPLSKIPTVGLGITAVGSSTRLG